MTAEDYSSGLPVVGNYAFRERVADVDCLVRIGRIGRFHVISSVEVEGKDPVIRPWGRWERLDDSRSAARVIAREVLRGRVPACAV